MTTGGHQVHFTRSRSGNKNDGALVEQKNWTHVRQLVGDLLFDADAELAVLNQIWNLDRVCTNYLLAQQKLVAEHRHGAKVTQRYDRAQTPSQRAMAYSEVADGLADHQAPSSALSARPTSTTRVTPSSRSSNDPPSSRRRV